jgi:hypothetical protein
MSRLSISLSQLILCWNGRQICDMDLLENNWNTYLKNPIIKNVENHNQNIHKLKSYIETLKILKRTKVEKRNWKTILLELLKKK